MNFLSRLFGRPAQADLAPLPIDCTVIDVRSPGEFASAHIEGAINIPLERIGQDITRQVPDRNAAVVLCCRSGMRSGRALGVLLGLGYRQVSNGGAMGSLALRLQRPLRRS